VALYLRFRPDEFQALTQVCRAVGLGEDFYPIFKYFLIESLSDLQPELSRRVAVLCRREVRLLFDQLQAWKRQKARARREARGEPDAPGEPLTFEEVQAVCRASAGYRAGNRMLPPFRDFLVGRFRRSAPGLVAKLDRMSRSEMEKLYEQIRRPRRQGD
jgi:hypothetical protein